MGRLKGLRVLVVEDEGAVALLIEDMLLELGCEIAGSAAHMVKACELASTVDCDFAMLDVNLDGQAVFPVARILRERGIPFVFSTGYGATALDDDFKHCPLLNKPFLIEELEQKLLLALDQSRTRGG